MRVTTSQLRLIIVNPRKFVANARALGESPAAFVNPQRKWMEAAWRAYFRERRDANVLWKEFNRRVRSAAPTSRRDALARGAAPMLEQFVDWEQGEASTPADCFPSARNVGWQGHILAIQRHLTYVTGSGYCVRQLWTDRMLDLDHVDADLMTVAILICADGDLGIGRTELVEAWHLRAGSRQSWERDALLLEADRLKRRLDDVADQMK
jgi:hypothetical protein